MKKIFDYLRDKKLTNLAICLSVIITTVLTICVIPMFYYDCCKSLRKAIKEGLEI